MINNTGYPAYNIWEHSQQVRDLYTLRCKKQCEEMTCHAQGAEILLPFAVSGDTLLDVGCGSGYFWHSLQTRSIPVNYWGIDAAPSLIQLGRAFLPAFGFDPEHLLTLRLEDLDGEADHIFCCNVLSNLDNYHRPVERLLHMAKKTVIFRESLAEQEQYAYVRDNFLDANAHASVYVNTYSLRNFTGFIEKQGFSTSVITDRRTNGLPENVIGYPHHWTFVLARRTAPHA